MTGRALATASLLSVMIAVSFSRGPTFLVGLFAGVLVLLIRYALWPALTGTSPGERMRRRINLGVGLLLWVAILLQILTRWIPGELLSPLAVCGGVWFLLDQPKSRTIDTFFLGLVALVAIVSMINVSVDDVREFAFILGGVLILVLAFGIVDHDRIGEHTTERRPLRRFRELVLLILVMGIAASSAFLVPIDKDATDNTDGSKKTPLFEFRDSMKLGSMARMFPPDAEMLEVSISVGNRIFDTETARYGGRDLLYRGQILDHFNGQTFTVSRSTPPRDDTTIQTSHFDLLNQRIRHIAAGLETRFGVAPVMDARPSTEVRVEPRRLSVVGDAPRSGSGRYGVRSRVLRPGVSLARDLNVDMRSSYRAYYCKLPPDFDRSRWRALGRSFVRGRHTLGAVRAIEGWFRQGGEFEYTLNTDLDPDDPLGSFVFDVRRGYCEYFSAAMVLMLRAQGIPARVARGFRGGTYRENRNAYIVQGQDAHAWVEVPIQGYGWIALDPTPGRTRLDVASGGSEEAGPDQINQETNADAVAMTEELGDDRSGPSPWWLAAAAIPLLLIGLLMRKQRREAAWESLAGTEPGLRGILARLYDVFERAGANVRGSATLREMLSECDALDANDRTAVKKLIRRLYGARYGARPLEHEERRGALDLLKGVRARLGESA